MPITVTCSCGKVFKVKDEAAGGSVRCQICGAELTVPAGGETPQPPTLPMAPPDPQGAPAGKTIVCPACAEDVPSEYPKCPYCGEGLEGLMSPEEQDALLRKTIEALDNHVSDPGKLDADARLRGGFFAVKTIVLALITAGAIAMIVGGAMSSSRDAAALVGFGVVLVIIFGIALLVSFAHDCGASGIQSASTPEKAFRRFFMAVKTRRTGKAYAAVAPGSRRVGRVETVKFEKIPPHTGSYAINDAPTFNKYWLSVFKGPSMQTRGVQLKKVGKVREIGDDFAVVEVECLFTNYPSLLILTILINLILCAILIAIIQKKTPVRIRKLLIKRHGRWFIADGEFEGTLDKLKLKGT